MQTGSSGRGGEVGSARQVAFRMGLPLFAPEVEGRVQVTDHGSCPGAAPTSCPGGGDLSMTKPAGRLDRVSDDSTDTANHVLNLSVDWK